MPSIVPGAFGYGMSTRGAYAGSSSPTICVVDNNNPSGSGSWKEALELDQPRLVVPRCSGDIDLNDMIRITSPYISVWGATAPSPGVNFRRFGIEIQTHDVMLSHIRIRPGEYGQGVEDNCGLIIYGQAADIVLDHLSIEHGPDENFAFSTYTGQDIRATAWRCISAECLDFPASVNYSAGHGYLLQSSARKVALIQSISATNRERNPFIQGSDSAAILNCLIYNFFGVWGGFHSQVTITGTNGSSPWYTSYVGNVFKIGANSDDDPDFPLATVFFFDGNGGIALSPQNEFYEDDTLVLNPLGIPYEFIYYRAFPYDPRVSAPPAQAPLAGFTIMPSTSVHDFVLSNAGCRPLDRDTIDTRVCSDIAGNVARGYRNSQNLYGTQGNLAVNCTTLSIPSNPHTVQPSGYTAFEEWAHTFNEAVEGSGATVTPGTDVGGTTDDGSGVPFPPTPGGVIVTSTVPCVKSSDPATNIPGETLPPVGTDWESTCEGGGVPPEADDLTGAENWDA